MNLKISFLILAFIVTPSISFGGITHLKGVKCELAWDAIQKEYNVFFFYKELKSMGLNYLGKKGSQYAILTLLDSDDSSCDVVLRFSDSYKDKIANDKFEKNLLEIASQGTLLKNIKN